LVTVNRWWTAPGSVTAADAYLAAHAPAGLQSSGTSSGTSPEGSTIGRTFTAADVPFATGVDVDIELTAVASGVGVRLDAMAVYLPPRPDIAALIPDPTSVVVKVERTPPAGSGSTGAPTVQRTLGKAAAQWLVAVIASLSPPIPGSVTSCPMELAGTYLDTLSFATTRGLVNVVATVTGCTSVTIEQAAPLTLNGSLDSVVLSELGLPADYGLS
jgi:hypothetical protein